MPSNPDPDACFRVLLVMPQAEREICVSARQHIWDAALAAGVRLPAMCHQGRCLTCAARLDGPGRVDQSDANSYFPQDREAGYVLPCTGKAQSDLRLRTHQQDQMRAFRRDHGLPAPYS